jgi:hypothetical protein
MTVLDATLNHGIRAALRKCSHVCNIDDEQQTTRVLPVSLRLKSSGNKGFALRLSWLRRLFLLLFVVQFAYADGGPAFDLDGPRIEVKVTRDGKTLPIGEVASLAPGDRLWVHPDLPLHASVHYVLVVAFLRGSTNPPPDSWFTKAETWNKKVSEEGVFVTIPPSAQQVLLFLAPETGGDFTTLRNAVRGRPGAFVRAAQDLHQASLDRARLDTYLAAVKTADAYDPKVVELDAKLLARSLNIKVDKECFDKPTEQQAPCLVQNPDQLILDNGRSQTVVQGMTSGPAGDMFSQMAYTAPAGGGYYSVYLGTVMDLARILDSFHTAQYQYLPALAIAKKDTLVLKLNNPPSFHKPQSVLVVGLPAVEDAQLPTLHPVDANQSLCVQKTPLVLPVEGAPYAFATSYAHDFALRVQNKDGQNVELPVSADPVLGGFVVDTKALEANHGMTDLIGILHGYWGFQSFEGPHFHLVSTHPQQWTLAPADQHALILGRKDTIHLNSAEAGCVDDVTVRDADGGKITASWKLVKQNEIQVDVALEDAKEGTLTLLVKQAGSEKPDHMPMHAYKEAGHLDSFTLYSGDHQGVLKGTRLDEVASMSVNDISFKPATTLTHSGKQDSLELEVPDAASSNFHANEKLVAKVTLKDGRVLDLDTSVKAPRPKVTLMKKTIRPSAIDSVVQLDSQSELPKDGKLTFIVRAESPATFSRDETIEIGSDDSSFQTVLSIGGGGIVLQDDKIALVTLDPTRDFGGSTFGPLRFRPVSGSGVDGDWQALATLVRVPQLKELKCSKDAAACTLMGTDLFLLEQVGADAQFAKSVTVPEGFDDITLNVPRPDGTLYLRLRDNPAVVNTAVLPVELGPPPVTASGQPEQPKVNQPAAPATVRPVVPAPEVLQKLK